MKIHVIENGNFWTDKLHTLLDSITVTFHEIFWNCNNRYISEHHWITDTDTSSHHLLLQSQQWKHYKNARNLLKVKRQQNDVDIILEFLLLTKNKLQMLFWCFLLSRWTCKCHLTLLRRIIFYLLTKGFSISNGATSAGLFIFGRICKY